MVSVQSHCLRSLLESGSIQLVRIVCILIVNNVCISFSHGKCLEVLHIVQLMFSVWLFLGSYSLYYIVAP